jgi:hypothetical protein
VGPAKLRRIVEKPVRAKSNSAFLAPTKRPRRIGAFIQRLSACSGILCLHVTQCCRTGFCARFDRDALGFRFFRDHPQQVDAQQTVAQIGGLDLDVIGQAERQLESPLGNA